MKALSIHVIIATFCLQWTLHPYFSAATVSFSDETMDLDSFYYRSLPLIQPSLQKLVLTERANILNITTKKYIPSNVWIAVRNISDTKPGHYLGPKGFIARNSDWNIHFCDNHAKDLFMSTYFHDTSLLWAYNILNPVIGTAKAELWRIAVLYVYGGMYMDDDANIGMLDLPLYI